MNIAIKKDELSFVKSCFKLSEMYKTPQKYNSMASYVFIVYVIESSFRNRQLKWESINRRQTDHRIRIVNTKFSMTAQKKLPNGDWNAHLQNNLSRVSWYNQFGRNWKGFKLIQLINQLVLFNSLCYFQLWHFLKPMNMLVTMWIINNS